MSVNAQSSSVVQQIIQKHRSNTWKAEQLSQLLLKQGAQKVEWTVEAWELGYEIVLKAHTTGQEVVEVYLESRLPSEATKLYVNPRNQQAAIAQLYHNIDPYKNKFSSQWLQYFDDQAKSLAAANQILALCRYPQTIKLVLQDQYIKVEYMNWKNARSLRHKKNYHMLKLDIAIGLSQSKALVDTFQFGKHMQVTFSDGSTKQNRREGTLMLAKIKELQETYPKD
ncbi:MAG TPA: hypothetical protein DCS93_31315 [Microscillaceae bacterium]|nr:hypothetical protein [Microscillaceae bacterium]